jgi:choline dehydrogenase
MGEDESVCVTDSVGRVYGVEGVRVADASLFPQVTNGNLNAPVIMVAEKISESILLDSK